MRPLLPSPLAHLGGIRRSLWCWSLALLICALDVSALRACSRSAPRSLRRRTGRPPRLCSGGEVSLDDPDTLKAIDAALQLDDVAPQLSVASPSIHRGLDGLRPLCEEELAMLENEREPDFSVTEAERELLQRSLDSLDYSGNWSDASQMRDSIVLSCMAPEVVEGKGGPEYTCPYNEFTAERHELHTRIIDRMLNSPRTSGLAGPYAPTSGAPPDAAGACADPLLAPLAASDEHRIFIVVGVPGSGKDSTLKRQLRSLGLPLLDASADLVKEYLAAWATDELSVAVREHDALHGPGKHLLHAQYLHRESVHLIDVLVERAMAERRSMLLEKTLFELEHVMGYAQRLAERGCRVHLLGTQITPLKNWEYLSARMASGQTFGRYISKAQVIHSLRQYHANLQSILATREHRTVFDTIHVFDVVEGEWCVTWSRSEEEQAASAEGLDGL